jgi:hypothetical protein
MSTLTLLCYVCGDKYRQAFKVEIGTNKSVADLKSRMYDIFYGTVHTMPSYSKNYTTEFHEEVHVKRFGPTRRPNGKIFP